MDELNAQIVPLVRNLLGGCGSFVRDGSLEIIDCRSGDLTARRDDGNCDRFTISVPYCGTTLRWQVIFNSNRPRQAPDFIFDDVDFCPKLANLKTLTDWDSSDENCLRAAVFELLMQYRDYQLTEARRVNVIRFETDFLSENDEYSRFETYVVKEAQEGRTRLCIQLPVDFSLIPSYFTRNLPGDDAATLSLVFYGPAYDRVRTKLRLSSRLEKSIGAASTFSMPQWGGQRGSCLMDYVPHVCAMLESRVDDLRIAHDKRKDLVTTFVDQFRSSLLEYDSESYSSMSFRFRFAQQPFHYILLIHVPLTFPQDRPVYILQSLYYELNGEPYFKTYTDYPYSPRWTPEHMAERLRIFLAQNVPAFQRSSMKDGTF